VARPTPRPAPQYYGQQRYGDEFARQPYQQQQQYAPYSREPARRQQGDPYAQPYSPRQNWQYGG
jgi:hypothetical protein